MPHCLRLMDRLAETAPTSADVYALVYSQQERISTLLENLIFLTNSGLAVADRSVAAKAVDAKRPRSPSEDGAAFSPPLRRIPLPPNLPPAVQYRPLRPYPTFNSPSARERAASHASLAVPYPASFNSSLPSLTPSASYVDSTLAASFDTPSFTSFNPFDPSFDSLRSSHSSLPSTFPLPPAESWPVDAHGVFYEPGTYEEEVVEPTWEEGVGEKGLWESAFAFYEAT